MSLIKCPECGREISDQATACPQCGFPLSKPESAAAAPAPPTETEPKSAAKSSAKGCGTALLIVFLGFIALVVMVIVIGASGSKDTKIDPQAVAYVNATNYIKSNYYSDAEFDRASRSINITDNSAVVSGKFSHDGVVYHYSVGLKISGNTATVQDCIVY